MNLGPPTIPSTKIKKKEGKKQKLKLKSQRSTRPTAESSANEIGRSQVPQVPQAVGLWSNVVPGFSHPGPHADVRENQKNLFWKMGAGQVKKQVSGEDSQWAAARTLDLITPTGRLEGQKILQTRKRKTGDNAPLHRFTRDPSHPRSPVYKIQKSGN